MLETRLTREEADALATRIPKFQAMLQSGVLFYRDAQDRDDLVTALNKIGVAIAADAQAFETTDWPPRPASKRKSKPRQMGPRVLERTQVKPFWKETE